MAAPPTDPAAAPTPAPGSSASSSASRPAPRPATPALHVLLAEHDPDVAELARRYLTRAGAHVTITTGADETTAALAARTASVAVLDLTMPGLDARRLRRLLTDPARTARGSQKPHGTRQPQNAGHTQDTREPEKPQPAQDPPPSRLPTVFLLSASMRPRDLRVAAESCLWRPFSPRLLVSRVLAIASRPPGAAPAPVAGPTAIPALAPRTPLTPGESALLAALAGHPGRVLSRSRLQAILSRTSPGHPASGRAIDVHVSQLRAKLPDPGVIRTVRGVGYILDEPAT